MKALIAAGGSGTRLRPLTFSSNKHLLPLANKPLLLYPLEAILQTGIKDIGVVVNETRPAVESLLGDGSKFGVKITYIEQDKPLGLAHVVKIAEEFLAGEPFVYHLGDNIFTQGIMRPFKRFQKNKPDALLTMVEHEENFRMGVPFFDEEGNLLKVIEKPERPPNNFGVPGLYFFSSNVFKAFRGKDAIKPSARGELEVTELYSYLLSHGYQVETEQVDGRWMDPGKFDDMLEANQVMLETEVKNQNLGKIDRHTSIEGQVDIGKATRVKNSQITGPVSIAAGCLIEDCQIGPNVSIAYNCKLQSVKISNSIILQDTTLFDLKRPLVDSMIGKNSEIYEDQQDSVSLFIGDHCKVRLT